MVFLCRRHQRNLPHADRTGGVRELSIRAFVIARSGAAKQSIVSLRRKVDCFASLAMTRDRKAGGHDLVHPIEPSADRGPIEADERGRPTAEWPAATDGSGMGLAQGDLQLNPSAQAASNSG